VTLGEYVFDSDLRQPVRPFIGPSHLLLLRHAMADHLVDRRVGNAAADDGEVAPAMDGGGGNMRRGGVPTVGGAGTYRRAAA
jgi:hypothetical protein